MSEPQSLRHVAIIPDGNRRWATARGKKPWEGHQAGFKSFEDILRKALDLNIYCVSFWGMSTDNFTKRDPREVRALLSIFKGMMNKARRDKDLERHDVKISVVGEWKKKFPRILSNLFDSVIEQTRERKHHVLNLLLCYDGKSEMTLAFKKALASKKPFASPKDFLWTRDLPPVDLVVRTGGDPHLSAGFMMWDTADAQLYFSEKLWPDFTPDDFEAAVRAFEERERRFGA
ncbi:MAG: polyprenyl diphosphate synthase [Patescibacteria group bacterium]